MSVLVDAQGEMIDDTQEQVAKSPNMSNKDKSLWSVLAITRKTLVKGALQFYDDCSSSHIVANFKPWK